MTDVYVIEKETGYLYKIKSTYHDCSVLMYELECVHNNEIMYVRHDIFKRNYCAATTDIIQPASCSHPQTWAEFADLALKDVRKPKILGIDLARRPDILDNITKIITKGPATIVFWKDGTKTVVKLSESERTDYDLEKGLAMAILKKQLGEKYYNRMKKVIKDKWEDHDNK